MAENKTKATDASVDTFLDAIEHEKKRADAKRVREIMTELTGLEPRMWGASLVGFGEYHYVYESGREGDFFRVGFSPRKTKLVLYIMGGFDSYDGIMERLGKYKTGKSCLYLNKLADVDEDVLRELITASLDYMNETYGA